LHFVVVVFVVVVNKLKTDFVRRRREHITTTNFLKTKTETKRISRKNETKMNRKQIPIFPRHILFAPNLTFC